MDIQKLEQLCKLKEKGIITEEEFEVEKKKILNISAVNQNINAQSEGINWGNALYALVATGFPLLFLAIFFYVGMDNGSLIPFFIVFVIEAFIFLLRAQKKQTYLYKNCLTPWVLFGLILISGPIAMCVALYQFYQIDDGLAEFK